VHATTNSETSKNETSSKISASPNSAVGPSRYRWRVVDIVVASVIGVASGVIFWAWGLAYGPLSAVLTVTPGFSALLGAEIVFALFLYSSWRLYVGVLARAGALSRFAAGRQSVPAQS